MIAFHSVLPELAQREARCLIFEESPDPGLPADEYVFVEYYCAGFECDCRRVLLRVVARNQPGKVFASIGYGWDKESFYLKLMDYEEARATVRGELDPINPQSEFAEGFLDLFRRRVLDEPYRLRLRRHYRALREEVARRKGTAQNPGVAQ
jgi:hypothetical protein